MVHFPASSTVLQRRHGYKEVFHHFSKLRLATRVPIPQPLIKHLLETKDVATLYELWCFFTVCRTLEELIGAPKTSSQVSISATQMSVDWEFSVEWPSGVKAHYNPPFSRSKRQARQTYSGPLRPDIAIETPSGELYLLDAKFKLDRLDSVMGDSDDEHAEAEERRGTFKRVDLYKMHTYRDAIPRAKSVWILYPGTEFRFFALDHTIVQSPGELSQATLEGVGAIPLSPNRENRALGSVLQSLTRPPSSRPSENRERKRERVDPFPDHLREFVQKQKWTYAKTMPEWPHEYLVRERVDELLFLELVRHIRENGYEGWFYRKPLTYYDEGGMTYWTMGAPIEETTIINRCRKEDTYESRLKNGTLPSSSSLRTP